jgi:rRNA maturation protein Nop10
MKIFESFFKCSNRVIYTVRSRDDKATLTGQQPVPPPHPSRKSPDDHK